MELESRHQKERALLATQLGIDSIHALLQLWFFFRGYELCRCTDSSLVLLNGGSTIMISALPALRPRS